MIEELFSQDTSDREVVIEREFDYPRELVFKAWSDSNHLEKWWGPTDFTTTKLEFDFKVGGRWRHVMHGPDGTDFPNRLIYIKIEEPELIIYSNGWDRDGEDPMFHGMITFEDLGGRTRLTMRMVFPTAEGRNMVVEKFGAIEGGHQTLARLAELLARGLQK